MMKPQKFLSRHVVVDGIDIGPAIVEVIGRHPDVHIDVRPFEREEALTQYRSETIIIDTRHQPHSINFETGSNSPNTKL